MKKEIRIIIADDNENILQFMENEFNKILNIKIVGKARNGEEELKIILDEDADIVITDNDMPIYTGLQVIEKVNKEKTNIPKFILVSGENNNELIRKAINLGVHRCFFKPLDIKKIIEEIEKISITLNEIKYTNNNSNKKNRFFKNLFSKKNL